MKKVKLNGPLIAGVVAVALAISISAVSAETIKIGASAPKTAHWPVVQPSAIGRISNCGSSKLMPAVV